jgi:predicted kinase
MQSADGRRHVSSQRNDAKRQLLHHPLLESAAIVRGHAHLRGDECVTLRAVPVPGLTPVEDVMLLIFSGLPGTGKTTLARSLARELRAAHLRIDTIEVALHFAGVAPVDDKGYRVAYALAEDSLKVGLTVIADSVNPIAITRDAWREVARRANVRAVDVEIVCSDIEEHRRRVEARTSDIDGFTGPTWREIVAREYDAWERVDVRIDTAGRAIDESCATLARAIASL